MKRWNQKGSVHAKRRMAELRARKDRLQTRELCVEFQRAYGIRTSDEMYAVLKTLGFKWEGWTEQKKREFYANAIAEMRKAAP